MTLEEFLSRLNRVQGRSGQYSAECPNHDDKKNSLSVGTGEDGKILLRCQAGCTTEEILKTMGLTMNDLFPEDTPGKTFPVYDPPHGEKPPAKLEAEYIYPGGVLKKIKMREADGGKYAYWMHLKDGKWLKGRGGIAPPLYTNGPLSGGVFLVEGEKDVETLGTMDKSAASLPDGAQSKWRPEYGEALKGRVVFIIQDNDTPGKEFAQRVAGELHGLASSVKVLDLTEIWPELPAKGDTTDLIEYMGPDNGWRAIKELINKTPEWTAPVKEGKSAPALVRACEVPYEPPKWLIAPYFQMGKGTLVQGDNGSGKTAFMCAVAAHVSTGRPLLGIPIDAPGDVLILSVEDDLSVLRGRIEADGGDLTKCHFMTNAAGLTFNSPEVEAAVKQIKARMIIFDPFQAFLGAGVDMFRSNETRPELAKLFEMCERNNCSCAIIAHMGKVGGDKSPVNRSLGSVDIPASMRSILQLVRNPENEEECVMVHVKCSNAPKGRSIAYTIGDRGGVHWTGFSPMTPDDLTAVIKRKEKGIPYEREPLVQVFNQLITDKPGGGFWSYEDVRSAGAKLLGFPPFYSTADLKAKLSGPLVRELQEKDGLIVTSGHRSHGGVRGIRIERYEHPQGYQTKIDEVTNG